MNISYSRRFAGNLNRLPKVEPYRPAPVSRYDEGALLTYDMEPVAAHGAQKKCRAEVRVERFVGGGFAGQVYRVRVESLGPEGIKGVAVGGVYALKILIPPSAFSNCSAMRFT